MQNYEARAVVPGDPSFTITLLPYAFSIHVCSTKCPEIWHSWAKHPVLVILVWTTWRSSIRPRVWRESQAESNLKVSWREGFLVLLLINTHRCNEWERVIRNSMSFGRFFPRSNRAELLCGTWISAVCVHVGGNATYSFLSLGWYYPIYSGCRGACSVCT